MHLLTCLLAIQVSFSSFVHPVAQQVEASSLLRHATKVVKATVPSAEAMARLKFETTVTDLYQALKLADYELSLDAFRYAMIGYHTALMQGKLSGKQLLTIIDFTKPSTQKRFYTIDLAALRVKFYTYVSHGKNTGDNEAQSFSNIVHSNQSSLGFCTTGETYVGSKGYSLKLDGLEAGYNSKVRERAVVIHAADYVSESWIKKFGRLGRSQGCPALPVKQTREIIDAIKGQTLIFTYFKDADYLQSSPFLNIDEAAAHLTGIASAAL